MNILFITNVEILLFIKWSYSPPNHVDYWALNDKHVLRMSFNFFWSHVFMVYVLRSTPDHIPLDYMCLKYYRVGIRHILSWGKGGGELRVGFALGSRSKEKCILNGIYFWTQDWSQVWRLVSQTKKSIYFPSADCQDLEGNWCHSSITSFLHAFDLDPTINSLGLTFFFCSIK